MIAVPDKLDVATLFETIKTITPTLHGWCSVERSSILAACVLATRAEVSCVIGTWGGRETIAMALAHKLTGRGKVVTIDPWSAAASVIDQTDKNLEWWNDPHMHENVYNDFLRTVGETQTQDFMEILRAKSDEVTPPKNISVLVIDGNHGSAAVRDAERFGPNVVPGGFAYLDDLGWPGNYVVTAADQLMKTGFRELYRLDQGMMLQRA